MLKFTQEELEHGNELLYAFAGGKWRATERNWTAAGKVITCGDPFITRKACQSYCEKTNKERAKNIHLTKPPELIPIPDGFTLKYHQSWGCLMPLVEKIQRQLGDLYIFVETRKDEYGTFVSIARVNGNEDWQNIYYLNYDQLLKEQAMDGECRLLADSKLLATWYGAVRILKWLMEDEEMVDISELSKPLKQPI